ncbi:hypothetical protein ACIGXA_20490 [Streptomyces fildesensis]|uniref:MftR C-terminal domain-containing protein n=1 Tax=Streptomyces fildesensis TaxID=375757 RepID=A0ABW8C911_9ACTN
MQNVWPAQHGASADRSPAGCRSAERRSGWPWTARPGRGALAAEVAERVGPPGSTGMYPSVLIGAAFAALQAAENRGRVDPRDLDALLDEAFDILIGGL